MHGWKARSNVVVSKQLLDELRDVLARPKFRTRVTPDEALEFAALLERAAEMAPDPQPQPGLTPDPSDDYLVALARAARVDYLVSGDTHLTGIPDMDPPVLTPRAFLDRIVAGRSPQASEPPG